MSKKNKEAEKAQEQEIKVEQQEAVKEETTNEATESATNDNAEQEETPEQKIAALEAAVEKEKREYMFLMAEFDNYRKRTIKEKAELIKNGGEKVLLELLPVVDDFERAIDAIEKSDDINSLKEGIDLIYNKFIKYLEKQQVKPMESTGKDYDSENFEAVTTFPAPEESMKGKVIDTVLKGYTINEKVLRHAKVVVGQ